MELFFEAEATREVSWAEGSPKDVSSGVGAGVSLRAVKNGRSGFASGTDSSLPGIRALFDRARDAAGATAPDPTRLLPRPLFPAPSIPLNGPRVPAAVRSEEELLKRLKVLERQLLSGDRRVKKALRFSFHEARGAHAIVSTEGVAAAEPWNAVSFSAEILGASGKETETAWGSMEKKSWGELDPRAVVAETRGRLLTSFGARPIRSGGWPVIFTPRVGVDLVELFSQALLADAVQKGRSCLAGRRGKNVGSAMVTFVDDGRFPGGLATSRWDDEGHPTQRTLAVAGGVLRSYLYDTTTARKDGVSSTGNAKRPGREAPPSPGVTNFHLAPGSVPAAVLYRSTPRAFVVRDVIGMHTADPVSGEFSVGASGILWEKGRPGRAVRGVTLSGNLLNLLGRVDAVAEDLTWQGTFGAPTFRVQELSIGGS
ncbi:MAG: TldD/PmbA family protein [Elusimicrobia bacterium]|nr:TldD/PmbA family protein [Elusimicrobiota bacterium]